MDFRFSGFSRIPQKCFCEYKCLSLSILNNKQFRPGNAKVFLRKLQWGWNGKLIASLVILSMAIIFQPIRFERVIAHTSYYLSNMLLPFSKLLSVAVWGDTNTEIMKSGLPVQEYMYNYSYTKAKNSIIFSFIHSMKVTKRNFWI